MLVLVHVQVGVDHQILCVDHLSRLEECDADADPELDRVCVNLVPPAIVILGIGMLAFGIRPRATSIVAYAVLGWSLLIVIVGGFGTLSHWVLDTSVSTT